MSLFSFALSTAFTSDTPLTPFDRHLNPELLFRTDGLLLFRLARARYANLSGAGAAVAAGRWNLPGEEAIYTSTEKGVTVLERLVHTPKDVIPSNLAQMTLRIKGSWTRIDADAFVDQATGAWFHLFTSLEQARSWSEGRQSDAKAGRVNLLATKGFALAVPSVIVPAWNVVLFPKAMGFWKHVSLDDVEPFDYDPRLFPERTPLEPL